MARSVANLKRAQERIRRWREDPIFFATDELQVDQADLDHFQAEVLKAFPHHNRIAMKACKGPGKTATEAMCAWNFLATRPHPKVAATSISWDNLQDNLWAEMAKWQHRSRTGFLKESFEWSKSRIFAKDHPETWFMTARTWPKNGDPTQQADTLAGLHADYLLFVLDESGGIPDAVMATAEAGLATGIETKIIQAGNPTHLKGPLYRAATKERHLWFFVEITGDPDDPLRAKRVSIQWAREQIEKYGKDNPWVLVNVFGQFPPASMDALLGADEVDVAMNRHYDEEKYKFMRKSLGIDVARFGDDATVITPRQGLVLFPYREIRNARSQDIGDVVIREKHKFGSMMEFFDDTGGWAAGAIDYMIGVGYAPIPINFSGKAADPRYLNKRAEMAFSMAQWVKNGGALPRDPALREEAIAQTYTYINGKLALVDKDIIKQELGRSPDRWDSAMLNFAIPDEAQTETALLLESLGIRVAKSHQAAHEWDPFSDERISV
jgi:hypothetical protein